MDGEPTGPGGSNGPRPRPRPSSSRPTTNVSAEHVQRLLNEADISNMTEATVDDNVLQIITDYFNYDQEESDDDDSTDDDESDDEFDVDLGGLGPDDLGAAGELVIPPRHADGLEDEEDEQHMIVIDHVLDQVEEANADRNNNDDVNQQVENYSCSCKRFNGSPCISQFTTQERLTVRAETNALKEEGSDLRDMYLIGAISRHMNTSLMTERSGQKEQKQREHQKTMYFVLNRQVCFKAFIFLNEQKSEILKKQERHLKLVKEERQVYRDMVDSSKAVASELGITSLGEYAACSKQVGMHYSFDFAQQVHFPSNPLQPGPMYFLTPRKCAIFGMCCEGLPQQVNYLIDEGMASSKGSNAVISYVHDFFKFYGLGETDVSLHCDNCSGQNKNRYVLWYLCWRMIHGLHHSISLNFMIVGHTKFGPDWCFGLLKQSYRRAFVSSLQDIVDVVRRSTVTGVNIPRLVGTEDQTTQVLSYNWQDFLAPYFKPLIGIKQFQHFRHVASQTYYTSFFESCSIATNQELFTPRRDWKTMNRRFSCCEI